MERDIEEKIRGLRGIYRGENNLDPLPAVLGDASGNITDPAIPGNVYVRVQTSNGLSDRRSVRAPATMLPYLKPGLPVLLGQDQYKRSIIIGVNNDALLSAGNSPVTVQTQQQSGGVTQANLETLRLVPTSPPSLVVCVKAWYVLLNGTLYWFPGAPVDLTASVPSAGNMCYAMVFVKADHLTTEVTASTPRGVADVDLDLADLQECIDGRSAGSTPVGAIELIGGQTVINETNILDNGADMRQMVNTDSPGPLVLSTANVSNPPSDAELDTAFGTPAAVGAGFMALLNDNGGGANEYLIWSDGSAWWYVAGTVAV